MTAALLEWAALFTRWFHFVAGVAWIGTSFYFIWVENALERAEGLGKPGVQGILWAIHGGGFYHVRKYSASPGRLPERLHWFKWEAYSTWLSGMLLMVLVYYASPGSWLMAPGSSVPAGAGVALGLAAIALALAAYLAVCSTPLLSRPAVMAAICLACSIAYLAALREVFNPRAAMIHLGAALGTIMAGNVLFVIIPGQRRLVELVRSGGKTDPSMVRRGVLRSTHNNYLTLPVLLIMVSSHSPVIYTGQLWWLKVSLLLAGSVMVRHFFNLRNRRARGKRWLAAGLVALALAVPVAQLDLVAASGDGDEVSFGEVRALVQEHCVSCHAASPSDDRFAFAPLGFVVDTDELIEANAEAIYRRTAVDRTMPFNNETGMTEDERAAIAAWHAARSVADN